MIWITPRPFVLHTPFPPDAVRARVEALLQQSAPLLASDVPLYGSYTGAVHGAAVRLDTRVQFRERRLRIEGRLDGDGTGSRIVGTVGPAGGTVVNVGMLLLVLGVVGGAAWSLGDGLRLPALAVALLVGGGLAWASARRTQRQADASLRVLFAPTEVRWGG